MPESVLVTMPPIDIKTNGNIDNYWSVYRGNLTRTGFVEFEELNIVENLGEDALIPKQFRSF